MSGTVAGRRIRITGLVQGVGFRPHVWRVARDHGITGTVRNDGEGVLIEAWGGAAALDAFIAAIRAEAPPLARIDTLAEETLTDAVPADFAIVASGAGARTAAITPDAATCPACLTEIRDPANRRFGYAFTNCTHCGPRLSIVRAIPYDRANTAMDAFPMCGRCAAEYADPADRRFHAQPNACPDCGPRLWLEDAGGRIAAEDPIAACAAQLLAGAIVAIKGLGGFHLACDATNAQAVATLRARKQRDAKPFALMGTRAMIERHCALDEGAAALLAAPAAPIVLLPIAGAALAPAIAPDQDRLGFMLPATPLHHLLFDRLDRPLVMTSANVSGEPQVTGNVQARERLAGIADLWLMHDRDILHRLDDSVVLPGSAPLPAMPIRRARGYAPAPLRLHASFAAAPSILAMGGELKASFCLLRGGEAILSPHIGDLEEARTHADYQRQLDLFLTLHESKPEIVAVDAHEGYWPTRWGKELAARWEARLVPVAHHHAHMAACLAEHGMPADARDALGLILDGLGLGEDGTLWGGELLRGGYRSAARLARFAPVALPGGSAAMREPWRNLLAHLLAAFGPGWRDHAGPVRAHLPDDAAIRLVEQAIGKGLNAPPCSSAGRLFDAVAAALGVHAARISHEGQAAMALEALARPFLADTAPYPSALREQGGMMTLDWTPFWTLLLADLASGATPGLIAARAHAGIAHAMLAAIDRASLAPGMPVALSGGVMQNAILAAMLHSGLTARRLVPLAHAQTPANDGGLALGQAVIAACAGS